MINFNTALNNIPLPVERNAKPVTLEEPSLESKGTSQESALQLFQALLASGTTREKEVRDEVALNERREQLRQIYAPILDLEKVGLKIAPRKERPFQAVFHFWKQEIVPHMEQGSDQSYVQAQLYANLLRLLNAERAFVQNLEEYIQCSKECLSVEKLIFSASPPLFINNLFLVEVPKWDLSSPADFACYLRFTKRFEKSHPQVLQNLNSNEKHLLKVLGKNSPGAAAQVQFMALKFHQSNLKERQFQLMDILDKWMSRTLVLLGASYNLALLKRFTPVLGSMLVNHVKFIIANCREGAYDPKTDPIHEYLALQGPFLKSFATQQELYTCVYEHLERYLERHLEERQKPRFAYFSEAETIFPTPREFEASNSPSIPTERFFLELLNEETTKKSKPKKKTKKKTKEVSPSLPTAASPPLIAPEKPQPLQGVAKKVAGALQQPYPYIRYPRVQRWLTQDRTHLAAIRDFVDYRDGEAVKLYEHLDEENLSLQLRLHGYSPFVDKLLSDPFLKNKYAKTTPKGLALVVEIQDLSGSKRGVMGYGLDQQYCFHRKIDLKDELYFTSQDLETLLNLELPPFAHSATDLHEELFSGFIGDEITTDPLEIIHILDRKNNCKILIYPLC